MHSIGNWLVQHSGRLGGLDVGFIGSNEGRETVRMGVVFYRVEILQVNLDTSCGAHASSRRSSATFYLRSIVILVS